MNSEVYRPKRLNRSSTLDRRVEYYPTPQVQSKLNDYIEKQRDGKISKNSVINDAVGYYLKNVVGL